MESLLLSQNLVDSLNQCQDFDLIKKTEIAKMALGAFGEFLFNFFVPASWQLEEIKRIDEKTLIFYWSSNTEQAVCPECKTLSHRPTNTYKPRSIQDMPIAGMTVYHVIESNRYYCDNTVCSAKTFVEQFDDIAIKDARLTDRLKDYLVQEAIETSCIGASRKLRKIGIVVSEDTIGRLAKKKAALVIEQNLSRDDVNATAIDDINLLKGNSSTACSVFIDAETHRVLVIVQGSNGEAAEKVLNKFPQSKIVSRDRATAYAATASKLGKIQVADGFHLVQNIHQTVKEALSLEVAHDLFVREGDGWISMVDSSKEEPASEPENSDEPKPDTAEPDDNDGLIVVEPATLATDDIEKRIHLADLTTKQADKYRKTLEVLELTEQGLQTKKIAKKLSMKTSDVRNYRKNAPETIGCVEQKIDKYYKMHEEGQYEHQKSIRKNARSSSESIVDPYKETVLRMFNEGKNHRQIHPIIVEEGFKGSANAVYQYLIKHAHENNIPYGRNSRVITPEERIECVPPRPLKISIERVSRNTIYQGLLHTAAKRKDELKQSLLGLETTLNDCQKNEDQGTPEEWINKTSYTDSIAEIIFDTNPKNKNAKKN
jgi:transposase